MASLIDTLIDTLFEENKEYETLLELSMEKTGVIVKADNEGLNEIVMKEQRIIEKINALEKTRTEVTKDIGLVLGNNPSELTVSRMI